MKDKIKKGIKYMTNSDYRFYINHSLVLGNKMTDEEFLRIKYKMLMEKELNLENPELFTEKLQWLKLNDRKDIYTIMADKLKMRDYIKQKIGEGYTIPLIGQWENPNEIEFSKLPNKFVLKCNHNSGIGICICKDKSKLNIKKVKKELEKGLKQDYYLSQREWPYKNIPRKIICEEYMEDGSKDNVLIDYKFFCFNGKPEIMYISNDGSSETRTNFYDMNFNKLDIKMKDKNFDEELDKPEKFSEMIKIAEKLSENTKFLRVDFYYINKKIYIGELTFFHNAGFFNITPKEWDKKLGDLIKLND